MLKNSKSIKTVSIICYVVSVLSLVSFVYELIKQKGNYLDNLGLLVGLLVGGFMFLIVGVVLNPPKIFNRNTFNFASGLVLLTFAGVTIGFLVYDCIKAFDTKTTLICSLIGSFCLIFGVIVLKIAKQDINVDARISEENKTKQEAEENKVRATKCPYCGCRLSATDTNCPNCKSQID